ncbi:MAG: precorrin-6y C5,15-methyltransferase (decarboxylating) subunit CbiE [Pirellulales bacterium]
MSQDAKIHVIGVGDDGPDGLTASVRKLVDEAQVLVGTAVVLNGVKSSAERIVVGNDLEEVVQSLQRQPGRRTVVLATGDPLFYGIARFLCQRLGKDRFEVVPHVSSMQLAFARVKESWDNAYLANLATVSIEVVVEKIRGAETVGLFTSDQVTPARVAQELLKRGIDYFSVYVCENLGSPDERVTQGTLSEVGQQTFAPLNVMVLVRHPDVPDRPAQWAGKQVFGNPDDAFLQSQPKRGLLTPQEVRVLSLADLDLGPRSTVWDIGAGSGAVAIEAAQLAADGTTYAIEMDVDDYQLIGQNAQRFGVTNLVAVLGTAPAAWEDLPDPDAVFVGGTGRSIAAIVQAAMQRLRPGGRLVANVNSLENLTAVHQTLAATTQNVTVRMVQIAHATDQLETLRLQALNPTFLIRAVKGSGSAAARTATRSGK